MSHQVAEQMIQWYWTHGQKRFAPYAVSAAWLEEVYKNSERQARNAAALLLGKARLGLWGPSQTGKSTFLSGAIDANADADGGGSALHWPNGRKGRFSGDAAPDRLVFNPFNFGSDGSGCITRYTLAEDGSLPDEMHPVELKFASEMEVVTALAAGYDNECEVSTPIINEADIRDKLSKLSNGELPLTRLTHERQRELVRTLEILSKITSRFQTLVKETAWRQMIVDSGALRDDKNFHEFRAWLLWDGDAKMQQTCDELLKERRSWQSRLGSGKLLINLELAAALLDIETYNAIEAAKDDRGRRLWSSLKAYGFKREGQLTKLGSGGEPIFHNVDNFGRLQALVGELVVPLRASHLRSHAPDLHQLLQKADLVDYPGLPNSHAASTVGNAKLQPKQLTSAQTLATVFKRGKTLSIVLNSADRLEVDGFLVLLRSDRFPARPTALTHTLQTWFRAAKPEWNPGDALPLPMALNITFFGPLLTQAAQQQKSIQPAFAKFDGLGDFVNPDQVTYLASTYPHIAGGERPSSSEVSRAVTFLKGQDEAFLSRFGRTESLASFDAMCHDADGGVGYIMRYFSHHVDNESRRRLLDQQAKRDALELRQLCVNHLPGNDPTRDQRDAYGKFLKALDEELSALPANEDPMDRLVALTAYLRRLFDLQADLFEPVPVGFATLIQGKKQAYVRNCLESWQRQALNITSTALQDCRIPSGPEREKLLAYMISSLPVNAVAQWLADNFGALQQTDDRLTPRRFLAIKLQNELFGSPGGVDRDVAPAQLVKQIRSFVVEAQQSHPFDWKLSAQGRCVIIPLQERLRHLQAAAAPQRPPQAGDAELAALHSSLSTPA